MYSTYNQVKDYVVYMQYVHVPLSVILTGLLAFPITLPQTMLCTLKLHTDEVDVCCLKQVALVDFVLAGQEPQSEVKL